MISPFLFKKYDIRGRALGDDAPLNTDAAYWIGAAFAAWLLREHGKRLAVLGCDNRITSPALARAFSAGLRDAGCAVVGLRQFAAFGQRAQRLQFVAINIHRPNGQLETVLIRPKVAARHHHATRIVVLHSMPVHQRRRDEADVDHRAPGLA